VGSFSALGGLRSSRETEFWKDLPEWFTRALHIRVSWLFIMILYATFTYWTVATFIRRGDLFYSSHGVLALTTVSLLTIGLVTGFLLERGNERVRTFHFGANIMGYLLLVGTISVGLIIT
jgi:small-conductance mechanosensitive channel